MGSDETTRAADQRVRDARGRLDDDADLWIATAHDDAPWLVPLSFHWNGTVLLMATSRRSRTYRNAAAGGGARISLGHTRDVVMLDGALDLPERIAHEDAEAVAAVTGVDPRTDDGVGYLRFVPRRAQVWRNYAETHDREVMSDGRWVTEP